MQPQPGSVGRYEFFRSFREEMKHFQGQILQGQPRLLQVGCNMNG